MQLDRIPPRPFIAIGGTFGAPIGVPAPSPGSEVVARPEGATAREAVRVSPWGWFLLLAACMSVLGQGERFDVDTRFRSPGSTLETYWRAIRSNDLETVSECFLEPSASLPFPGMLWFLPPVQHLELRSVKIASGTATDLVVIYEVHFTPQGTADDQVFSTSSELRRTDHEWRIVPPRGEAGMPQWKPYPRPIDI